MGNRAYLAIDLKSFYASTECIERGLCCPFRLSKTNSCPCNHKNWNNGKKNRGCTKYKAIPADYRLSIDRECSRFKRTYALRTECERYNSRFKASGQERLAIYWVVLARRIAQQRSQID